MISPFKDYNMYLNIDISREIELMRGGQVFLFDEESE